jgi:endo-1,4-beta-xylanase
LRELAEARGIFFGTDIADSYPNPWQNEEAYIKIAHDQFNLANWDYMAQWAINQPNGPNDEYNFDAFDAVVPFMAAGNFTARTNAIMPSAHNLLDPVGSGSPPWLIDGYNSQTLTASQLQDLLKKHIDTVVPHWLNSGLPFNGLITVNEAIWNQDMEYKYGAWPNNWVFGPDTNLWRNAFNDTSDDPLMWFKKTFEWTRQAVDAAGFDRSQVPLFFTDYGIETSTPKADAVYRLVKEMLDAGVPIDGVGFQAHMQCDCMNYPNQPGCDDSEVVGANLQRFIDLGLKVRITELDVTMVDGCTEDMQAAVYGSLLQACLDKAPHCDSFMLWGFTDNYNWLSDKSPCILDKDYQPKPAFFTLQEKLAKTNKFLV